MIKASSTGTLSQPSTDQGLRLDCSLPARLEAIRSARQPLFADEHGMTPAEALVHGHAFRPIDDAPVEVIAPAHRFVTAGFRLLPQAPLAQRISLPLHLWRQPAQAQRELGYHGCDRGDPWENTGHDERRHSQVLHQWRHQLDCMRDRLEAFVSSASYVHNAKGMLERRDFPVLYRIDKRTPQELLATDGFGASHKVRGVAPMLSGEVLVASACLRASDIVLNQSHVADEADHQQRPLYQYAIRAEGIQAASWAENYRFQHSLPALHGQAPELGLDEVHLAAGQVRAAHIYLIGCSDAAVEQRLETMLDEHAEAHFGVSIARYAECQTAERDESMRFLRHVQESHALYNDQLMHRAGRHARLATVAAAANQRQLERLGEGAHGSDDTALSTDNSIVAALQDSLAHGVPLPGVSPARSALLLAPHIIGVLDDLPARMGIVLVDPQQRHWRFVQDGKRTMSRAIQAARPGDLMIRLPSAAAGGDMSSAAGAATRPEASCHIAVAPRSDAPSWRMLAPRPASRLASGSEPALAEPLFQAIVEGLALAGVRQSANSPARLKRFALCAFARRAHTQGQTVQQQHHADLAFLDAAGLLWSALTASSTSGADAMRQMSQAYREALHQLAGTPEKLACLLLDDRCDGISVNQKLTQFLRCHGQESTRRGPRLMYGAQQLLADHLALLRELRDTGIVSESRLNRELARGGVDSLLRLIRETPGMLRALPQSSGRTRAWNATTVLRLTGQPGAPRTSRR